jgi:hypothetical protein
MPSLHYEGKKMEIMNFSYFPSLRKNEGKVFELTQKQKMEENLNINLNIILFIIMNNMLSTGSLQSHSNLAVEELKRTG